MARKAGSRGIPKFSSLVQKSAAKLKDQAEALAVESYIGNLARFANKTLGKFLESIEKEGAKEALLGIDMARIAEAFKSSVKNRKGRKKAFAAGGRLSRKDKAKLQEAILAFVKANPDCRRKEIAKNMNMPTKKLFSAMKGLIADGKLATKGQKAGMTYSVKK